MESTASVSNTPARALHSPDCKESEIEEIHPPVVPHVEEVVGTSRSQCEEHSGHGSQQVVVVYSC